MKSALLIGFLIASPNLAIAYEPQEYAACAQGLAEELAQNTQLGITETKRTDFGYSDFSTFHFNKYSNSPDYFYSTSSSGKSAFYFGYQSTSPNTSFQFNLGVRFYEAKHSPFGSGKSTKQLSCCLTNNAVELTDLGSKHTKTFDASSELSCSSRRENAKDNKEEYSEFKDLSPNLCTAFGKKIVSWNARHDWTSSSEHNYDCGTRWKDKTCTYTSESENRDIFSNTGCKLTLGHPNDVSEYEFTNFHGKHSAYKPGDVMTADGKIQRGRDKSRLNSWLKYGRR